MTDSHEKIHAFRKVSDAKLQNLFLVDPNSVGIEIQRKVSDSNVFRKNSDNRILGEGDMKFAALLAMQKAGQDVSVKDAAEVDEDMAVPADFVFTHFPGNTLTLSHCPTLAPGPLREHSSAGLRLLFSALSRISRWPREGLHVLPSPPFLSSPIRLVLTCPPPFHYPHPT